MIGSPFSYRGKLHINPGTICPRGPGRVRGSRGPKRQSAENSQSIQHGDAAWPRAAHRRLDSRFPIPKNVWRGEAVTESPRTSRARSRWCGGRVGDNVLPYR